MEETQLLPASPLVHRRQAIRAVAELRSIATAWYQWSFLCSSSLAVSPLPLNWPNYLASVHCTIHQFIPTWYIHILIHDASRAASTIANQG